LAITQKETQFFVFIVLGSLLLLASIVFGFLAYHNVVSWRLVVITAGTGAGVVSMSSFLVSPYVIIGTLTAGIIAGVIYWRKYSKGTTDV